MRYILRKGKTRCKSYVENSELGNDLACFLKNLHDYDFIKVKDRRKCEYYKKALTLKLPSKLNKKSSTFLFFSKFKSASWKDNDSKTYYKIKQFAIWEGTEPTLQ